jgi:hypothetical protein
VLSQVVLLAETKRDRWSVCRGQKGKGKQLDLEGKRVGGQVQVSAVHCIDCKAPASVRLALVSKPGDGSGTHEGRRGPGDVKIGAASGKNRPEWGRSGAGLLIELCAASRLGFSTGLRLQDG